MLVDRHREQLHARLVLVAASVEKVYITAVTPPGAAGADAAQHIGPTYDAIAGLAVDVQSDVMAYMARFRPVAADLYFATAVLGCSFDLHEAAAAIAGIRRALGGLERPSGLPSVERLMSYVRVVISLMADAIVAWDASCGVAALESQRRVTRTRDQMHGEIARALAQPDADVNTLIEIDAIGCLLQRVSSASGSCIRRLAKRPPHLPMLTAVPHAPHLRSHQPGAAAEA